jgi:hypothetical protein
MATREDIKMAVDKGFDLVLVLVRPSAIAAQLNEAKEAPGRTVPGAPRSVLTGQAIITRFGPSANGGPGSRSHERRAKAQ